MKDAVNFIGENKDFKGRKVALMDLEGTLTPGKRYVPEDPNPEDYRAVLKDEEGKNEIEVGYWSGLHLLAGEKPSDYFERVEKWWRGEISLEEFEGKNVEMWNELAKKENLSAPDLVEWYNTLYLDLRERADELVKEFQDAGFVVGILSHTSRSLSELAAEKAGADFVVTAWDFNFEDGDFKFTEKKKYADEKAEIVDELKDRGVEKIFFVGNGKNDFNIAEKADKGYLIENKEDLDYRSLGAFTGGFKKVFTKIRKDLEREKR